MQLLVVEVRLGSQVIIVWPGGPSREEVFKFLYVPAVIYQGQNIGHPALRSFLNIERTPLPPMLAKLKLVA